jgi:gliding motility-associated-like protein
MNSIKLLISCFCLLIGLSVFSQPVADFTVDTTKGCGTLVANFKDLSTGNPTTWLWNFGDGTANSSLKDPSHFYSGPGTYTVTLTVSNASGSNTKTKTAYIVVYKTPSTDYSSNPNSGCVPLTVNFTDLTTAGDGALTSWQWNFGDGTTSTQQNPVKTYNTPGTYSVSLFVSDVNGCKTEKLKSNLITATSKPTAKFTVSDTLSCKIPHTVTITNTSTGTGLTYFWSFGNGTTSNSANPPSVTYNNFGNFTIQLIVTDQGGCKDTATATVKVNVFNANFTSDTTKACVGSTIKFSDLTGVATSWNWSFSGGNPASSTQQNPSVSYSTAGTYSVTLIASNQNICKDTITKTNFITIFPNPNPGFTTSKDTACKVPFNVTFNDTTTGAAAWQWSFGNGNNSTLQNPSNTYTVVGNYTVSVTVTDINGCKASVTKNNLIKIITPKANFSASPLTGCKPLLVNFTDNSNAIPSPNQWIWDFGDGTPSINTPNPSHIYTDTGSFNISLKIINAEGCTDSITLNNYVQVGMKPIVDFIPKDTTHCHPFPLVFTDQSSSYANNWKWNFGDGKSSTVKNPATMYTDTGYFNVTLIAGHYGCFDTLKIDSAVHVLPAKPIFTITPQIGCDTPHVVTFADMSQGADIWTWTFGDGSPSFNGQIPPPHTYNNSGFFNVKLVVQNIATGCTDSLTKVVSISKRNMNFVQDTVAGCTPLPIHFTSTTTTNNGIASYLWDFGDGTNSFSFDTIKTYSASGIYTVKLYITDNLGCTDSIIKTNLIDVKALPSVNFTSDTNNGCKPLLINFQDLSTGGDSIVFWQWNFGDGSVADTTKNPAHTFNSSGQFDVTLIAGDNFNCKDTLTLSKYINVTFPLPAFSFTSPVCNYVPINFTNTSTGAGLTYIWNFGDNTPNTNDTNSTHVFLINSDTSVVLNVQLTAIDSNGCIDSLSKPITISIPNAKFSIDSVNADCPPFNAQFTDSSSADVVSWNWNFGDGSNTVAVQNPSHTYSLAGNYSVTLIVTNNNGCKDTSLVDSLIVVEGPSGTFSVIQFPNKCFIDVTFNATLNNTTYVNWVFGDGGSATNINPVTYHYNTPGSYIPVMVIKDASGCKVDIPMNGTIDVPASNILPGFITDTNNVFPGTPISFTDQTTNSVPIAVWIWSFGDGDTLITTSNSPIIHEYESVGTYTVIMTVTDQDGCVNSTSHTITIVEGVTTPPNIFTPNGDGVNDAFFIKNSGMKEHELSVFNRWGELLFYQKSAEIMWQGTTYSGLPVPSGTYYYILQSNSTSGNSYITKGYLTLIR